MSSIQDVALPQVLDLSDCGDAEFYAYHEQMFERVGWLYQPPTAKYLKSCAGAKATTYIIGRRALEARRREVAKVFEKVDVLVTPTIKYSPRTIKYYQDRNELDKPFPPEVWNTWLFNIFGLPAMSVPCGFTSSGLPIGVMIAGAPFAEQKVLALGHAFEQSTSWHLARPKIGAGK